MDRRGADREVVAIDGALGSVLVVDRAAHCSVDARLVAHLDSDEPSINAQIVCREYLAFAVAGGARPRQLTREDLDLAPAREEDASEAPFAMDGGELACPSQACCYRLGLVCSELSIPELRWRRFASRADRGEVVSLREVVGGLQAYEPARTLTHAALRLHGSSTSMSTAVVRQEQARLARSPIVLNRGLREAVLATIAGSEVSMSAIAIRCGRIKRDRRGNVSGETSWLGRRIGLLPEGGASSPTPWIHSQVLALIARRGLAISPREVEL